MEANVKNIQRAIVTDKGNIVHFEERISRRPRSKRWHTLLLSLWMELLDDFRAAGFADVRLLTMYSDLFANYGQLFIFARK